MNSSEVTRTVYGKNDITKNVSLVPVKPQDDIHIFKGAGGYKLSVGNRHLTLAELVYVVDTINAIRRYGH